MRLVDPGGCGIRPAFSLEVWRQHKRPRLAALVAPADDPAIGVYSLSRLEVQPFVLLTFVIRSLHAPIVVRNEGALDAGGSVLRIADDGAGVIDSESHAVIVA